MKVKGTRDDSSKKEEKKKIPKTLRTRKMSSIKGST